MITSREYHTATLLRDGRVLVADGTHYEPDTDRNLGQDLSSAELYDPHTSRWTATVDGDG
jgi:hypothetical protein